LQAQALCYTLLGNARKYAYTIFTVQTMRSLGAGNAGYKGAEVTKSECAGRK